MTMTFYRRHARTKWHATSPDFKRMFLTELGGCASWIAKLMRAHDVAALTDTSYAEAEGVLLAVLDKQAYSVLHG